MRLRFGWDFQNCEEAIHSAVLTPRFYQLFFNSSISNCNRTSICIKFSKIFVTFKHNLLHHCCALAKRHGFRCYLNTTSSPCLIINPNAHSNLLSYSYFFYLFKFMIYISLYIAYLCSCRLVLFILTKG